jgi:glycosyltransferase involved in cell wall biosynthesis
MDESRVGIDLYSIIDELGISDAVFYVDQTKFRFGLPTEYMVIAYNAIDVLLNPSLGEGFGIPILEAESCGTPVIANDATSMTELVSQAGGWLIRNQPFRTAIRSWWAMPQIESLVVAMEAAYLSWANQDQWKQRKEAARRFALQYDFGGKIAPMWDEYLKGKKWKC